MAAIPITIVGTLTGKATKEGDVSATEQVVIQGIASLSGLEVGGGPMPGGPPPEIWPSPGRPTQPIYWPPEIWPSPGHPAHPIAPGGPISIWPSPGHPAHPIVIPPPTEGPEPPTEGTKPPPPEGGWGYHPDYGWGYFPPQGGKPQPGKRR